jgi:hypothetical protein
MRGIVGLHLENAERYPRLGEPLVAMVYMAVADATPAPADALHVVAKPGRAVRGLAQRWNFLSTLSRYMNNLGSRGHCARVADRPRYQAHVSRA